MGYQYGNTEHCLVADVSRIFNSFAFQQSLSKKNKNLMSVLCQLLGIEGMKQ